MDKVYDVLILGAGPAGLSAGIYACRAGLSALIIEKANDGGQIALSAEIENYPGQLLEKESGPTLVSRMTVQAARFGAERASDRIVEADIAGEIKILKGSKGEYRGRSLIIAAGASKRPIGCEGEADYIGRGISYCATCDANFFRGLEVFVVGGGDAAVEEAMYLTKFARKVTLIHRRSELRAAKAIQKKAFANPKLSFLWDSVVQSVGGEDVLDRIILRNVKTGELSEIRASEEDGMFGLFGFVGAVPESGLFAGLVDRDEAGYILTDENMHTSADLVYAAGDIRAKSLRQVVTAAADGAVAAVQAEKDLSGKE